MSKTFKITVHDGAENTPRSARRLVFNAEFLKAARLCTGDIIAISGVEQGPIKVCAYTPSGLFLTHDVCRTSR